jgi:hypothetical protein
LLSLQFDDVHDRNHKLIYLLPIQIISASLDSIKEKKRIFAHREFEFSLTNSHTSKTPKLQVRSRLEAENIIKAINNAKAALEIGSAKGYELCDVEIRPGELPTCSACKKYFHGKLSQGYKPSGGRRGIFVHAQCIGDPVSEPAPQLPTRDENRPSLKRQSTGDSASSKNLLERQRSGSQINQTNPQRSASQINQTNPQNGSISTSRRDSNHRSSVTPAPVIRERTSERSRNGPRPVSQPINSRVEPMPALRSTHSRPNRLDQTPNLYQLEPTEYIDQEGMS